MPRGTCTNASIDSLGFHLAISGLGVFMGYLIHSGLGRVELLVRPPRGDGRAFFDSFPLFPLCMIGGLMVPLFVATCTQRNPIDHYAGWRPAFCLRVWSLVPTVSGTRTVALHSQESRANAPGESGHWHVSVAGLLNGVQAS